MKYTYNNLKPVAEEIEVEEYEELQEMYREEEKQDFIVAKIYCDNIGYLSNRARKYKTVEEEDKASYALESIHDALLTHDGRDIKLMTLIGYYFERKLKNEIETQNRVKRELQKNIGSIDEMAEASFENDEVSDDFGLNFTYSNNVDGNHVGIKDFNNAFLKIKIKESDILTSIQKEICTLLVDNNGSLTFRELGDELDISHEWARVQLKRIKEKDLSKIV